MPDRSTQSAPEGGPYSQLPAIGQALRDDHAFLGALMRAGAGEDGLTELQAGLLRDPSLRRAFVRQVLRLDVPEDTLARACIRTQVEDAEMRGIPDLEIRADADLLVLIENKLGAAFTANQPHEYFRRLAKWRETNLNGVAALVIQAPGVRVPLLEEETWRRLRERVPGHERSGDRYGDVFVRHISWSETRDVLHGVPVECPVTNYLKRSFAYMVPEAIKYIAKPFTTEQLMQLSTPVVLNALVAMQDTLRDLRLALKWTERKVEDGSDDEGYSLQGVAVYPLNDAGTKNAGQRFDIQVSAAFALRFGHGLLSMQLTGDEYKNVSAVHTAGYCVIQSTAVSEFGWVERPVVPLSLRADEDPPEQVQRLLREIEEICCLALDVKTHAEGTTVPIEPMPDAEARSSLLETPPGVAPEAARRAVHVVSGERSAPTTESATARRDWTQADMWTWVDSRGWNGQQLAGTRAAYDIAAAVPNGEIRFRREPTPSCFLLYVANWRVFFWYAIARGPQVGVQHSWLWDAVGRPEARRLMDSLSTDIGVALDTAKSEPSFPAELLRDKSRAAAFAKWLVPICEILAAKPR